MKGKIMKKGIMFVLIICISSTLFAANATRSDLGFGAKYSNYDYLAGDFDYQKEIYGTMLSMSYENSFENNGSITNFINADLLLTNTAEATHSYMNGNGKLIEVEENFFGLTDLNIIAFSIAIGVRKYITLFPLLDIFIGAGFRGGIYDMNDSQYIYPYTSLINDYLGRLSVGYIFDGGFQIHITDQLSFNLAGTYGFDFFVFYYDEDVKFNNYNATGELITANAYITYRL
jgi:hypothetical protein